MTYFYFLPTYELECDMLVKFPVAILDSPLALREKERHNERKNMNLVLGSSPVAVT